MKTIIRRYFYTFLVLAAFAVFCNPLHARIVRVYVIKTEPYMESKIFGSTGTFLRITGQIYGEVDPANYPDSIIQDIQLAPKNRYGNVEYISDFVILRPADMTKSNGLLFLSLPNRGNMFPADSLFLSRGYTYAWCAWQGDVLKGNPVFPFQTANGHFPTVPDRVSRVSRMKRKFR